jgi:hypothetical protein
MAVRMSGLALAVDRNTADNVVVALNVGLLGEIQIAAVGLAFAGKRGLQIFLGLRTL